MVECGGGIGGHAGFSIQGNEAHAEALVSEISCKTFLMLEDGLNAVEMVGGGEAADGEVIDVMAAAEAVGFRGEFEVGDEFVKVAFFEEFVDGGV